METSNKDVLFNLATMLDLNDLLSLCSTSKKFNELICQRNEIWNHKLQKEFPDIKDKFPNMSVKRLYIMAVRQNEKLAKIFESISRTYSIEIDGFKRIRYRLIAKNIRKHSKIILNGYQAFEEIRGVDMIIGDEIDEILKSGDFLYEI